MRGEMRRLLPVLICFAAACGSETEEEAAAGSRMTEEQALAARHACAAEELVKTAEDDLATIEQGFASGVAPEGLTTFARAYLQHARLRYVAYSQQDSAVNHSSTPEDSARHARTANRIQIVPPAEGTMEANVINSYSQKAAAILADADHPCNWKHELTKG
jgi:hypothetical protein